MGELLIVPGRFSSMDPPLVNAVCPRCSAEGEYHALVVGDTTLPEHFPVECNSCGEPFRVDPSGTWY